LLKEKTDKLIDDVIKPKHVQPASMTNDHNYIADMRYTGKWFEVSQTISMDECLKLIEKNPIFMP